MRFQSVLVLGLAAVLMVSGCAKHAERYPNSIWTKIGNSMPQGYTGQNRDNLLKPKTAAVPEGWNYIDNYDGGPVVMNNPDVDMNPTTIPEYTDIAPMDSQGLDTQKVDVTVDAYGQMVHQFFFLHGSSRVSKGDRVAVKKIASDLKGGGMTSPALVLVGFASARVDGVLDPARKRAINLEMSQKRAVAIATAFKKAGVAPTWIETISKGDEGAVDGASVQEEAKERRVDVYVNEGMSK